MNKLQKKLQRIIRCVFDNEQEFILRFLAEEYGDEHVEIKNFFMASSQCHVVIVVGHTEERTETVSTQDVLEFFRETRRKQHDRDVQLHRELVRKKRDKQKYSKNNR